MKAVFFSTICVLSQMLVYSRPPGHKIEIKFQNYSQDKIILAYRFGDRIYIKDTLAVTGNRSVVTGASKLDDGVYMFVTPRDNKYAEFLIDGGDQEFSLELDFTQPVTITSVTGSEVNEDFNTILRTIAPKRAEREFLQKELQSPGIDGGKKKVIEDKISAIDKMIIQIQKDQVTNKPQSLASLMIKANLPMTPPTFKGSEDEIKNSQYLWYKQHWFDNLSMNDPRMIRVPVLAEKVDYYLEQLTIHVADSLIRSVDEILSKLSPAPESYQYFLTAILNKFAQSNNGGMDAVYVHIALKYYAKGKAPWADASDVNKIVQNARDLEPVLIGKKAPDIEVETTNGSKIHLNDFTANYTVLIFWSPLCTPCEMEMLDLKAIAANYKDKGVKVLSIGVIGGTHQYGGIIEKKDVKEFIGEYELNSFANTIYDQRNDVSSVKRVYKINITPHIFILDKNKIIVSREIAAKQVKQVLDNLLH